METTETLFVEIFPVETQNIPKLIAYQLDITKGGDISTVGGKLAYRLRRRFGGHWVWTTGRILSDALRTPEEIMILVKELWHEQPTTFGSLKAVGLDHKWQPTPQAQADFVARGLVADIEPEIEQILRAKMIDIGNARIERLHDVRGWLVEDKPAISISVSSRLIYKQDLKEYSATLSGPEDLLGLWVADKTSTLKGEIIDIVGNIGENRDRLLAITTREEMQELIKNAPNEELVVQILPGHYQYIIGALRIIVRMDDFQRFNINSSKATNSLRIEPKARAQLVGEISKVVKNGNLIRDSYNSKTKTSNTIFITSNDVGFAPNLCFGGNQICPYEDKILLKNLSQFGLYKHSPHLHSDKTIRIGIINALDGVSADQFKSNLTNELIHLGINVSFVGNEETLKPSRETLEKAINSLQTKGPDILLAFFRDEFDEDEEEWGAYHRFKSITVGRGIPSQVVYEATINKRFAMGNIILGVLGKTGNIPFILAEPLPYADLVVGIDIARERKKKLPGSVNATAIARIYFGNGEFLRYVIHDTPLEGETVPDNVLESLFPVKEITGKRVVIHRDGYFRGEEKQALKNWARKIGAEFYLVEVIKTGTPRIYASQNSQIRQPIKGSAFRLSQTEAFLISSLPPFAYATPQPLRIRTELPFTIEKAIHSILSLTLLHYGSTRPPRLPVTIHYSDKIAYLALRGIKPKELEGSIPYWL